MGNINITGLDKITVKDLDRSIELLTRKLEKGNLSSTTRKTNEKRIEKYRNQTEKTRALYRKYKNKQVLGSDRTLQSFNIYTLSVKSIYEKINGVGTTKEIQGGSFKQWWGEHEKTNKAMVVAGGISLASLALKGMSSYVENVDGIGAAWGASVDALGKFGTSLYGATIGGSLGWTGTIALGGGVALAGIVAGRIIYKKHKERQAAKEEAEELLTKGTAQDRDAVAKTENNSKLFEQFVADAVADEAILKDLVKFSLDPDNDPDTIIQARKIVKEARNQIAIKEAKANESLYISHILTSEETCKLIEQYATLEKIKELYDDYQENIKDITEFTHTNLDSNSTKGKISDLIKAKNKMKGGNLDDAKKLIGKMSKDDFVKDIIGESKDTYSFTDETAYNNCKSEVESFYDKANKILQDEKVTDANQKLSQIKKEGEASEDFELDIVNGTLKFKDETKSINLKDNVETSYLFNDRNKSIAGQCGITNKDVLPFCASHKNIIDMVLAEIRADKEAVKNSGMNN